MFRLAQHGTTPTREVLAGITTFAAMAYILVVNPDMLATTGMDRAALITATALAAAAGSLLMGLFTNYPIALAPGMGLNAFFTFTICGRLGVPWEGALGLVFWTGVLFLVLSLTRLREEVVRAIPDPLKTGIQAGIGLFIVVIGLQNLGLVGTPGSGFVALRPGDFSALSPAPLLLALLGSVLALVLLKRKIVGALLIAIAVVSVIGLFVTVDGAPVTPRPDRLAAAPASLGPLFLQVDWLYPFRHWETTWLALLTLVFVDLFDSIGTLVGVSRRAGLTDEEGELPGMRQALASDAGATAIGACLGVSPTTAYIESATGVEAGGRTGLTAVVVAGCFLLALTLHPLIAVIPAAAVAPALLLVGGLMMQGIRHLDWSDWRATVPALATVVLIPLNFQIAEGIAAGCVLYVAVMTATGRWRRVHWVLALLAALFAIHVATRLVRG